MLVEEVVAHYEACSNEPILRSEIETNPITTTTSSFRTENLCLHADSLESMGHHNPKSVLLSLTFLKLNMSNYDAQTINSKNPIARFSHRTRVRNSIRFAKDRIASGRFLDYGCGSGVFIDQLNRLQHEIAYGYEPFMEERTSLNLPIFRDFDDLRKYAPYATVTLFETLEHLSDSELAEFLDRSFELLQNDGCILISAPIEIGPALLMKELNRSALKLKMPEHHFLEFVKAAFLGIPARRAPNIKCSHRGFDFRAAIRKIEVRGWKVSVLGFSPLPILGWYGNSQVFLMANKQPKCDE